MEALYCGCDVLLMHSTGTGEVVTDSNFPELRERNFGFTTCQTVYGVRGLAGKIMKVMEARTAGRLLLNIEFRKSLRSQPVLERLEEIYAESIQAWKQRKALYTADELQKADNDAMSDYFLELRKTMRFN